MTGIANFASLYHDATQAFIDDDFETSTNLYTQALQLQPGHIDALLKRSAALSKLHRFEDALQDANTVLGIESANVPALLRKGIAEFGLEQYSNAKLSFEVFLKHNPTDKTAAQWLRKCNAELDVVPEPVPTQPQQPQFTQQPAQPQPDQTQAATSAKPTVRREWYQTDSHVFVSIFIKNVKREDASINISEQALSVTIKLPHGSDYSLELDLAFPIIPSESGYDVLSTKIEIKFKKAELGTRWPALEGDGKQYKEPLPAMQPSSNVTPAVVSYPSSSRKQKNWDRLEKDVKKEEEEEKPEGEAALQKLFKQIYSNATDEQRRAMNKSYTESGGTSLSTNWTDVGQKTVPIQPPDGMEAKKFES